MLQSQYDLSVLLFVLFFNDTPTTDIYTLSLHDALPILRRGFWPVRANGALLRGTFRLESSAPNWMMKPSRPTRSEEHTSELQSLRHLVCRLLLEKKKRKIRC